MLPEAIDFVVSIQTSDGSFKYNTSSSKLPCFTARVLAAIGQLGFVTDKRFEKSYRQLLSIHCADGGWRCKTVKTGKSLLTDASNPETTLYILDAFRFRKNTKQALAAPDRAVSFILDHWDTKKPLGSCNFGIGARFLKTEFPFLRYNLFYYAFVLSFYKKAHNDKRFKNAYQILFEKTENEVIVLENPHKSWRMFDFTQKGKTSIPAKKRFQEIDININTQQ